MQKRIYLMIPAMCCALVMTPCMAYAGEYTTEVTNNVTLGDVSISLSEYELDEDGKEVPYQNAGTDRGQDCPDYEQCECELDPGEGGIYVRGGP